MSNFKYFLLVYRVLNCSILRMFTSFSINSHKIHIARTFLLGDLNFESTSRLEFFYFSLEEFYGHDLSGVRVPTTNFSIFIFTNACTLLDVIICEFVTQLIQNRSTT